MRHVCPRRRAILPLLLLCWYGSAAAGQELPADRAIEVTSLTFEGVESVDEARLRNALGTRPSDRVQFLGLGTARYFNRAQFDADLRRIPAFYADRGFPQAAVSTFDLALNPAQTAVDITIVVSEGDPVVLEEVRFTGFEVIPEDPRQLLATVPLRPDVPRDRHLVQIVHERALDYLRDHGYPYGAVSVLEHVGATPRTVIVEYRAQPGTMAFFGPIEVVGTHTVSDELIRRQLAYREGDLFRLRDIQESQRRMYRLELFDFATIDTIVPEEQPAEVPTRVTVAEGDHRRVTLGVGYGSEERGRGELNWRHVNFLGGGRTAGVDGKWSWLDRGVRLNFQQPYLFGPMNTLAATAHRWFADEPAYTINTSGGRVSFSRQMGGSGIPPVPATTTMSLAFNQEFEEFAIADFALEDPTFRDELIGLGLDPRTGTGRGRLSAVSFDLTRSTVGNLLDARAGAFVSLHLEQAGIWLPGTYNYYEVVAEGRHYVTIARRAVLASRVRAGSLEPHGELLENVPFFKRYFLGGSQSLRGWGRFQVSPLSGFGLPLGGHSMFETSVELRFSTFGGIGVVLFADGGNAWTDPWGFQLNDLRYAVGPGLRYDTPVGPVRFDVGYQINPLEGLRVDGEPEARRWRMHFSIGQAF